MLSTQRPPHRHPPPIELRQTSQGWPLLFKKKLRDLGRPEGTCGGGGRGTPSRYSAWSRADDLRGASQSPASRGGGAPRGGAPAPSYAPGASSHSRIVT